MIKTLRITSTAKNSFVFVCLFVAFKMTFEAKPRASYKQTRSECFLPVTLFQLHYLQGIYTLSEPRKPLTA